jgi:hypothetical protein
MSSTKHKGKDFFLSTASSLSSLQQITVSAIKLRKVAKNGLLKCVSSTGVNVFTVGWLTNYFHGVKFLTT